MSRYDQRLKLVRDIITSHSQLDDTTAADVAAHVLRGLDTIPEKVR